MGHEVVQLVNDWLYDVDRFLRNRLDSLKEDLVSEDPETQSKATREVEQILDWLYLPLPPLSATERLEKALSLSQQDDLSTDDKEAASLALCVLLAVAEGDPAIRPRNSRFAHSVSTTLLGCHGER